MNEQNKALIRRWFEEVWNQGRADVIDQLAAQDVKVHGLAKDGRDWQGLQEFKKFHRAFRNAFPDIRIDVTDTLAEGERVVGICRVRGTHTGDGLGIRATHRSAEFYGVCILRFREGKIVEGWNHFDFLTLYTGIGAMQLPAELATP